MKQLKYDLLLFDLDNTILDFASCEVQVLKHTFQSHGIELSDQQVARYLEINDFHWKAFEQGHQTQNCTLENRFKDFCGEVDCKIGPQEINRLYLQGLSRCAIFEPHAEEVLLVLKDRGYRMGILTNGVRAVQQGRFESANLERFFDHMITIDDAGVAKPHKGIFEYALNLYGLSADRVVYIGDHWDIDMVGAGNACLHGIHYTRHTPHQTHMESDHVIQIPCLKELLGLL